MLGFSAYLHSSLTKSDLTMFDKFVQAGFKGVFTSINLPEDDPQVLLTNLKKLGQLCDENQLGLTLDVSSSALKRLNLTLPQDLKIFKDLHVTMLRIDDGISIPEIAQLSQEIKIALNASTIVQSEIDELRINKADFENLEAWHNYYPRENTGLDAGWFADKNRWLKQNGFTVMAFVAGNENLRAPVYKGLPTLEENRYENPFVAALDMNELGVDRIYIGDPAITTTTFEQFRNYFVEHILQIRVQLDHAPSYITQLFHQRADVSRDVVRLREGRLLVKGEINPRNSGIRKPGSITLDNVLAGRYQGELQLVKYQLSADNTVNVIGQIVDADLGLMKYCVANQAIQLIDIES